MNRLATDTPRWPCILLVAAIIAACGQASEPDPLELVVDETSTLPSEEHANNTEQSNASTEQVAPTSSVVGELSAETGEPEFDEDGIEVGFTEEGRPYRGNPNAPVVLEEFSDYQCPFCSRFYAETLPGLEADQIASGEVLLVFYDFPISSIHPQAIAAANAARCAGEQSASAYWNMHDLLFSSLAQWSSGDASQVFVSFAEQLELDVDVFTVCVRNNRYLRQIQEDVELGRQRGVNSTPSFFINGQLLIGAQPLSVFNQAIVAVQNGENIANQPDQQEVEEIARPTPAAISLSQIAARLGEDSAPVTIVEYTDYQCPYCQRHNVETMPQLVSSLIESGRAQYVIKDFPLDQIHPEARLAAVAARCAGEQASYWEMHDVIFSAQGEWGGQGASAAGVFTTLASDLNLNVESFESCLGSGRYDAAIQADLDEGISLGVRGTPFFFVNGFPVNGAQPYALFEYAVELAEQGTLAEAYAPRPMAAAPPPTRSNGPVNIPTADSFAIGDPDAPVTIVEYTDLQCPFCGRHFEQTFGRLKQNYIDQGIVRYVLKDFPLTSIHANAVVAAEAARCAGVQDAHLEMHDALFSRQGEWSNRNDAATLFRAYAENMGLDGEAFSRCLEDQTFRDAVMADLDEGIGLGIRGTPSFFINGVFLSGAQPYSVFQQAISSLVSE